MFTTALLPVDHCTITVDMLEEFGDFFNLHLGIRVPIRALLCAMPVSTSHLHISRLKSQLVFLAHHFIPVRAGSRQAGCMTGKAHVLVLDVRAFNKDGGAIREEALGVDQHIRVAIEVMV